MKKLELRVVAMMLFGILLITGCVSKQAMHYGKQEINNEVEQESKGQQEEIDYQKVHPNEAGEILVVMYHGLARSNSSSIYQRTAAGFKKDLQYMYEHGYRPVTMKDYIDNSIDIAPGYTPIVLTFDDGLSTTFSLVEEAGELKPGKDCLVDIMDQFAKVHPDFGKAATFFINANPFKYDIVENDRVQGPLKQRIEYLLQNGYEIGNHTYSHARLDKLGAEEIQAEIGKVNEMVQDVLPAIEMNYFSYPFGVRPDETLRSVVEKGKYNEKPYHHRIMVREAPRKPYFVPPIHKDFEPLNVPRVCGTEGNTMDLWWYFEQYELHPERRYISDGNSSRISVPKGYEKMINSEKLGDKELYIYQ